MTSPPGWQLPPGVPRSLWDYVHAPEVARGYDANIADSPWAKIDVAFAQRHFSIPGRLIDLGCGTGRALVHFAGEKHQVVGVDLSEQMLACTKEKADAAGLDVRLVKGNLVDLGWVDDRSFDYAVCLFSTLGMIAGAGNRRRFMAHVFRILRPGGRFVVHVHNRWRSLWNAPGRAWLLRDALRCLFHRRPVGDHESPAHEGLAGLRLHLFTRSEIVRLLRWAGFRIVEIMPLGLSKSGRVPLAWCFSSLRAYGYLLAAERRREMDTY